MHKSDGLYVRGHILNTQTDIDFLIDTGAELTVIPSGYLSDISMTTETIHVTGATGKGTFLTKTQRITFLFGAQEFNAAVWMGEVTEPLLVLDVLMTLNSDFEFIEGKVT